MKIADFREEKKLLKKGIGRICGLDEVGRGPLAGPVVACAVVFDLAHPEFKKIEREIEFRDSKLHTSKKRQQIFKILTNSAALRWSVDFISEKQIDQINIVQASMLAMRKAVGKLKINPEFLLIDGRHTLENYPCSQKAVIKGDEKIASIAAASIIAKVLRDQEMEKYHQLWPQYGFDCHKGYGTGKHLAAISRHGPCPIHRLSFAPFSRTVRHAGRSWRRRRS